MVVFGAVEVFPVGRIKLIIVLGTLYVEVVDPAQLAVDVPLLRQLGVVGHPRPLHFVLLVGIELPLRVHQDAVLQAVVLAEVLLYATNKQTTVIIMSN